MIFRIRYNKICGVIYRDGKAG